MKKVGRCLLFLSFIGCWGVSSRLVAITLDEIEEIKRIQQKLEEGELHDPPAWTLIHMADEKEKNIALEVIFVDLPKDEKSWNMADAVQKSGGLSNYKKRVAGLLESRDATVRGFAAVWLADLEDKTYAKQIAHLLQSENQPGEDDTNKNWARGQAAFALGILDAQEYKPTLVPFLKHQDIFLRSGAASGLARMKAKEFDKEIASLLQDKEHDVICAAIAALAELDAKSYSGRIAEFLKSSDYNYPKMALEALVKLDAKDQMPQIAKLLDDDSDAGQAAITLALLGGDKYVQNIAELLKAGDPSTRADAIVALGIMRAVRYVPEVEKQMQSKEDIVKHAASWAIIMMESKTYAKDAIMIQEDIKKAGLSPMGIIGRRIPQDRLRQLREEYKKSLARVNAT